jgi:hypothetical protein
MNYTVGWLGLLLCDWEGECHLGDMRSVPGPRISEVPFQWVATVRFAQACGPPPLGHSGLELNTQKIFDTQFVEAFNLPERSVTEADGSLPTAMSCL